jgi:hypothetical protein
MMVEIRINRKRLAIIIASLIGVFCAGCVAVNAFRPSEPPAAPAGNVPVDQTTSTSPPGEPAPKTTTGAGAVVPGHS